MNMEKKHTGYIVIALISMLGIVGVSMLNPIAQNPEYHLFIDQQTIIGIPNFWNVISNLPFLLVGIMGLYSIFRSHKISLITEMKAAYIMFFLGISLVAFGSGYYHLSPNNGTLLWDRLPMTIAFMALFSIIINEFTLFKPARFSLWPLIFFGAFSILYWHSTENIGKGDLRLYILVQFLPMLLIPVILLFFKSKFTNTRGYWILLFAYVLAKAFEYFDEAIQNILLLSGHSIKHVVAALGVFFLLKAYNNREST